VTLLAAVEFYNSRHASLVERKTVADIVTEFIEAKEQDGRSDRYLRVSKNELARFASAFGMPITEVTAPKIELWLRSLGLGLRSRKNMRSIIVTLFNFARSRGYLPREQQTEANFVARITAKAGDVGVFSPAELRSLLNNASEEILPFIAIGGFAGVRTEEILRLDWEDVRWEQNFIILGRNKTKTATRRIVPILPALAAWLAPYRGKTGRVCLYARTQRCAQRLGAQLKIKWRKNVLRHSFISYRVAACQNVHQVALECGNSPRVIDSNYRELVAPNQAEDYFNIMPPSDRSQTVVPIPLAA
jgi:integrase